MSKEKTGNWFARHKILTVIGGLFIFAIVASAVGGNNSGNSATGGSSKPAKEYRFAGRADKQKEDIEIVTGESGTLQGVKLTVNSVEYKTSVGEYDNAKSGNTYVQANITLTNNDKSTHAYNPYDFRVQTVAGQVLDPAIVLADNLNSGDLVSGGTITGDIYFEVPIAEGHEYLIWKPGALDAARVVAQIK